MVVPALLSVLIGPQNKHADKIMATMAANTESEDRAMILQQRLQAVDEPAVKKWSYTLNPGRPARLTGRGSRLFLACVSSQEMAVYRAAQGDANAVELNFAITVTWGGSHAGHATAKDALKAAIGTYRAAVEAPAGVEGGFHRYLVQSAGSPTFLLAQKLPNELQRLDLYWLQPGTEGAAAVKYTKLAALDTTKTTGTTTIKFKKDRRYLCQHALIDGDIAEVLGTAKPKAPAEVQFLGAPGLPASASPPGLAAGLAELVSAYYAKNGQEYGKAELRLHCSAATVSGKVDATENWRQTGRPRKTVASMGGQHVLVQALFRSRVIGDVPYHEHAIVTPLRAVANTTSFNDDELLHLWGDLGLVFLERAGPDKLCPVAGLSNVKGYTTPIEAGGNVVAAIAPWVGLRSSTERVAAEPDEGV